MPVRRARSAAGRTLRPRGRLRDPGLRPRGAMLPVRSAERDPERRETDRLARGRGGEDEIAGDALAVVQQRGEDEAGGRDSGRGCGASISAVRGVASDSRRRAAVRPRPARALTGADAMMRTAAFGMPPVPGMPKQPPRRFARVRLPARPTGRKAGRANCSGARTSRSCRAYAASGSASGAAGCCARRLAAGAGGVGQRPRPRLPRPALRRRTCGTRPRRSRRPLRGRPAQPRRRPGSAAAERSSGERAQDGGTQLPGENGRGPSRSSCGSTITTARTAASAGPSLPPARNNVSGIYSQAGRNAASPQRTGLREARRRAGRRRAFRYRPRRP